MIKQLLKKNGISVSVEAKLIDLLDDGAPDTNDLMPLFEEVLTMSPLHFIVIDAIDECSKKDRQSILTMLRSAMDISCTTVKVFIASRPDLDQQVKHTFKYQHHVSMDSLGLQCDIISYVRDVVTEMTSNGELVVSNPALINEIQEALVNGAQGMFATLFFERSGRF